METYTKSDEDKTVAILSYITLIGFIIALVMYGNNKTKLGAYHLRQALGFLCAGFAFSLCQFVLVFIPIVGWLIIMAIGVFMLVCWIMGLISAINGEMKPMPLIGEPIQNIFKNTFN
ncbi:MAG: DUF4870 domain-containing protein [Bacteroidota bacterium]|nr:DUF4870 domain-containing protein [Bacteroidota bacterium]